MIFYIIYCKTLAMSHWGLIAILIDHKLWMVSIFLKKYWPLVPHQGNPFQPIWYNQLLFIPFKLTFPQALYHQPPVLIENPLSIRLPLLKIFFSSSGHTAWIWIWMTKRRGATSDNGFIFKKINENENIKEKKRSYGKFLK